MSRIFNIALVQNIGFNAVAKVIAIVLSGVANVVLAWHLGSRDYGIAGFALIIINLFSQFNDFGINNAVIQRKELKDRSLYTGFTMKVILGLLVFAASFLIAPLAKYIFSETAVVNVIKLLSLNFLVNSLSFIPVTILTRELNFKTMMLYQIAAPLVSAVTSIVLAVNGFTYWSIVIGNVCATLASVILINILKPVKVKIEFDRRDAREFVNYGAKMFYSQLLVFAIINLDNFLVGTVAGAEALGYYALAFNWGSLISVLSASVILTVLFPTFAKIQHDRTIIKDTYLRVMKVIAFIIIMVNLCLFSVSREFLVLILGHGTDKWLPSMLVLKIFCVYGIGRALLEPVGSVVLAIGRTDLLLKSTLITAFIETAFLYPALRYYGIPGVAIVVTMSYMLQYFIYFPALRNEINLDFREMIRAVRPAIVSGLLLGVAMALFMRWYGENQPTAALFTLKLVICTCGYIFMHGLFSKWTMFKEARIILATMKA
ncbi:MAG TPA: lipopolysaccharide biosynthesis protein [Nitrospirota bacterium]|nr:lipopolysaccharide biosynthesis protein [Nitrospirota bacterium]